MSLCYIKSATTAAVPVRREKMYLQFLWHLIFSPSLLTHALPTMGSVNSMHSEIQ